MELEYRVLTKTFKFPLFWDVSRESCDGNKQRILWGLKRLVVPFAITAIFIRRDGCKN